MISQVASGTYMCLCTFEEERNTTLFTLVAPQSIKLIKKDIKVIFTELNWIDFLNLWIGLKRESHRAKCFSDTGGEQKFSFSVDYWAISVPVFENKSIHQQVMLSCLSRALLPQSSANLLRESSVCTAARTFKQEVTIWWLRKHHRTLLKLTEFFLFFRWWLQYLHWL